MGKWLEAYRQKNPVSPGSGTYKTDKRGFRRFLQCDSLEDSLFKFCQLVRQMGTQHGVILGDELILPELDAKDIEYLQSIETEERQQWAELLAYRLAQEWQPRYRQRPPPRPGNDTCDQRTETAQSVTVAAGDTAQARGKKGVLGHGTG